MSKQSLEKISYWGTIFFSPLYNNLKININSCEIHKKKDVNSFCLIETKTLMNAMLATVKKHAYIYTYYICVCVYICIHIYIRFLY